MSFLSIQLRTRLGEILLAFTLIVFVWLLQTDIMNRVTITGLTCNLPLTVTIVWASVFGSPLNRLTPESLRDLTLAQVSFYQALTGSFSGALVGATFAALYASVLPIYPISYPVIGWLTGYFSLKRMNQAQAPLISIPLVLLASVLAEFITAGQLTILGRSGVTNHFMAIALPESILNALIAPLIYLPMRRWYEFRTTLTGIAIE
jgi:rod shape-determining protein MreD